MEHEAKCLLEEKLNRVANSLRLELQNLQDAEEMEMSIALGENLRHQLRDMFNTLEKQGINVSSR